MTFQIQIGCKCGDDSPHAHLIQKTICLAHNGKEILCDQDGNMSADINCRVHPEENPYLQNIPIEQVIAHEQLHEAIAELIDWRTGQDFGNIQAQVRVWLGEHI
jgi:hypothetical protein